MQRATKIGSGLAGLVVAGSLLFGAAMPARAVTADHPDWNPLRDWFTSYGVTAADQSHLISTLDAGGIIDSMRADAVPVSTRVVEKAGSTESITTFADHSITVGALEKPQTAGTGMQPRAIAGCSTSSGGGYASFQNCTVSQSNGTVTMTFKADYSRWATGASISNYREANAIVNYGSATQPDWSFVRTTGSGATPATVTAHSRYTTYNNAGSEELYLSLRVSSSQAWTTTY